MTPRHGGTPAPPGRARGPLVVVGDALLDVDLVGRAGRLMPEAPVPVLDELEERPRPGGAALAAALAVREQTDRSERHEVVLVTAVADDEAGERLAALVRESGVRLVALPLGGTTSVKRRVRAGDQTLLRLDEGAPGEVGEPPAEALAAIEGASGVLVADYGRGVAAQPRLRDALARSLPRLPVVWDPHPRGTRPLPGVRLVTPNQGEAETLAEAGEGLSGLARVSAQASALVEEWGARSVAVTLGERGALLSHGGEAPSVLPSPRVVATDTCGAGDAFAAAALCALADGSVTVDAVQTAVAAAAAYVAAGGASAYPFAPSPADPSVHRVEEVRRRGGTVVATGGCFDLLHAGHVATLEAARALGDCLVVCLNSDDSVRRLKGPTRPLVTQADRARVLAALECVDEVVVFEEDTPVEVLRRIRPDVWAKGGDYAEATLPEAALLREWGGQAVVLPYLQGRSTTSLVRTASTAAARAAS